MMGFGIKFLAFLHGLTHFHQTWQFKIGKELTVECTHENCKRRWTFRKD